MTWGATLQDLRLEGHAARDAWFPDFESYPRIRPNFGQTAGPQTVSANRIAEADGFVLDNVAYQLECNEARSTICTVAEAKARPSGVWS